MMIFYFISGIGGTLFAATYSDLYAVGPEPAILGMTAGLIGWFIFNWNQFEREDQCKEFHHRLCFMILLFLIVGIMIYFIYSSGQVYLKYATIYKFNIPDGIGMMGGFIYGISSIFWLLPPDPEVGQRVGI